MRVITAEEINRILSYPALIDALREGFRADIESPLRHTHMIPQPSGSEAKYLLMPAWTRSGERVVGCKIVSVFPDNAKLNKPAVFGSYLFAELADRAGVDLLVHGHAHDGTEKGATPSGIPVRNVAQPVLRMPYAVYGVEPGRHASRAGGDRRADASVE